MTFEKLETKLMDVVLEEQAKLGFAERRSLYSVIYMNHLLGTRIRRNRWKLHWQDSGEHDNKAWKTGCEP